MMKQFWGLGLSLAICFVCTAQAQNYKSQSEAPLVADAVTETSSGSSAITPQEAKAKAPDTLEDLQEKALKGDVEAQLNLGYMYLYGVNGTNIDYQQALDYYTKAAEQNSAVAYNNLGSLYFSGIGTDVDKDKAMNYFQKAAELGSHDAAVNLAIIYLGDANVQQNNSDKILALLNQAKKDNTIAKYLLGYSYLKGFMVHQDYKKAFQLIKAAADEEYDEAQFVLTDFYMYGRGATKNYNKVVQYLQAAAKQGNIDAMMQLASILAEGKIYTADVKRAHILYNVASVMGNKEAAGKRDALEANLDIADLLAVQAEAEDFKAQPSEKTTFIRQTFGNSLKNYIDKNISLMQTQKDKKEKKN